MKACLNFIIVAMLVSIIIGPLIHYGKDHAYYKDPIVVTSIGQCISGKGIRVKCAVGTNTGRLTINLPVSVGDVIVEECVLTRLLKDNCYNKWVIYNTDLPTRTELLKRLDL